MSLARFRSRWAVLLLSVGITPVALAVDLVQPAPAWSVSLDQAANFGESVASAGDVNGDGYDDVIVGAPDFSTTLTLQGRVFLYHGSSTGLSPIPAWTVTGSRPSSEFGFAIAGAGDVNGDGFDDILIGDYRHTSNQGIAFLYLGSATGLSASPAWTGTAAGALHYGFSVSSAGDLNNDGFSDVAIGVLRYSNGQTFEGAAFTYHGSPTGLPATPDGFVESNLPNSSFGYSVSSAGDVNNDGYDDLLIGGPAAASAGGFSRLHLGSAAGVALTSVWEGTGSPNQQYGASVSGAGDINGDNFDDFLTGSPSDGFSSISGEARAFYGSQVPVAPVPAWALTAATTRTQLGKMVAPAGNLNSDGYSDIVITEPRYTPSGNGPVEGRLLLYAGSNTGLLTTATQIITVLPVAGSPSLSSLVATGAGDVNGDGADDLLIGTPTYTSTPSGSYGGARIHYGIPLASQVKEWMLF